MNFYCLINTDYCSIVMFVFFSGSAVSVAFFFDLQMVSLTSVNHFQPIS